MRLSREELFEVTETGKLINSGKWKYGHLDTYVFEKDNAHYKVSIAYHHSEGLMSAECSKAVKVNPVQKVITEWVEE